MKPCQILAFVPFVFALQGPAWAQTSKASTVIVGNTSSNPVPVAPQGTTTVTGTVTLGGTPSVTLSGTPSVTLSGTPTVKLGGSPDVVVANSPSEPIPVTGKVEVIPSPPPSPRNQSLSGATSGSHSFPIDPPVKVDVLAMSSRDRLYLEFVGSPPFSIELAAGSNVVVPMPQGMYVSQVNTQCSDPDGLCEFFIINMLGPQQ